MAYVTIPPGLDGSALKPLSVSGPPSTAPGVAAPVGSIAYDTTNGVYYVKYGTAATAWKAVTGANMQPKFTLIEGPAVGEAIASHTVSFLPSSRLCYYHIWHPGVSGASGGRGPASGIVRGGGAGGGGPVIFGYINLTATTPPATLYLSSPATPGASIGVDGTAGASPVNHGSYDGVSLYIPGKQAVFAKVYTLPTGGGIGGTGGAGSQSAYGDAFCRDGASATNTAGANAVPASLTSAGVQFGAAAGGGAGGSLATDGTQYAGGAGGYCGHYLDGGAAGALGGGNGGAPSLSANYQISGLLRNGGSGGGGGGSGAAVAGGNGASGAKYGGGGGGGGASRDGYASGAGGAGGIGAALFIEW